MSKESSKTPSSGTPLRKPVAVPDLREMKARGEKITMLTCYDASFAAHLDAAGLDAVLVGDSLGMVVQGHPSTLPVTLETMLYHSASVARGLKNPVLLTDLPFMSFADPARALDAGGRLLAEGGASMVKLEGAGWVCACIEALATHDIPVCAHLGLTPQSVHRLGGYRVQGRERSDAERLLAESHAVQSAGAALLVLECVPADLAARITAELEIPTIGIGAGNACDGQVLVLYDMLGITPGRRPRFGKDFLADKGSVGAALSAYVDDVRAGRFPAAEHSY